MSAPPSASAAAKPSAGAAGAGVDGKIRCDACPVLCYIADGRSGACDRYANRGGTLVRLDPLTVIANAPGGELVPFLVDAAWDGDLLHTGRPFVTAVGAGTTYPDYKPAPFIIGQSTGDADMVTVVTEGIFSYCGAKVKIDTDRHIGEARAVVRVEGEAVGHVTTAEYGSRMLSLGGVEHLTGGGKKEGRVTCATLVALCNGEAVEMTIDDGATVVVEAGAAPIINGATEARMRVGCGSATIGMFARQWVGHVDEVVVVDDHITGVLSEHQSGRLLGVAPTGIRVRGRRSTPGRYFQVARSGTSWGGTDVEDPLTILGPWDAAFARPGLSVLMVSTTGEQAAYFVLDETLTPRPAPLTAPLEAVVARIAENCEAATSSVVFVGGAGGSLRAGATDNPIALTRSVKSAFTRVTCGGAPAYVWPGGGITVMVDVTQMPAASFGSVPTPALVAPIEFTMRRDAYAALGGHVETIRELPEVLAAAAARGLRVVAGPAGEPTATPAGGSG